MGTYQETIELTRNSSGRTRPQSSQLAEPLWTDPGLKNGISVRELISTLKKEGEKSGGGGGINGRTFSHNYRKQGKSHHHLIALTSISFFRTEPVSVNSQTQKDIYVCGVH